jgi:hypothetical protein
MMNTDPFKFTCSVCGGYDVTLMHVWNILADLDSEQWQEWGPLKDNHHWQYEFKEKLDENEGDEPQLGYLSEFAEDDSDSNPEDYEVFEPKTNQEDDEFFVNCGNYDKEIEFGWSEPDCHGLIFPVEFSDFIPNECWPDPKYVEIWDQRGWLRPKDVGFL